MFQLTLRALRISCGYILEEVAKYCGISEDFLGKLEEDSGEMPLEVTNKLSNLYGVSQDLVYFGLEADCIKHNRILKSNEKVTQYNKKTSF